ncbi:MAG: YXWGXW repeat-containing protein [Pseudomonadota bacterium]
MKRSITLAALLALGAASFVPTAAMARADISVFIGTAPPAPRFESVPPPRAGYVWAPGFWNWEGNRHVWSAGRWENARQGHQFQRSEWVQDNDGWRLNRGGWQQVSGRDYGDVRVAPPPPRFERSPRARRGHVWIPGHWSWRGNRHEWVRGSWVRERHGYVYHPSQWMERDGRWMMEPSRWDRRDSDRDGIPNGRDRDRDNDGVRNDRDRDRDGDGVPNRRDNRPDNPRRD